MKRSRKNKHDIEIISDISSAKSLIMDFDQKVRDTYVRDDVAPELGSPYYYFRGTVTALLNRKHLIEEYEETDSLEQIKGRAEIIWVTHEMYRPSKRRELWKDKVARELFIELISIVDRLCYS